jgi:hypothetical protein
VTQSRNSTARRAGALTALALAAGLLVAPSTAAQASALPAAPQTAVTVSQGTVTLSTSAVTTSTAAAESSALARPANGRILYRRVSGGLGRLKIRNRLSRDVVVTLTRGGKKALSVYVRARKSATVRSIPDGTYRLFWMAGYRYNTSKRRFMVGAVYRRSYQSLRYTTIGNTYRTYTLTLRMSKYGGGSSQPINPRNFPV